MGIFFKDKEGAAGEAEGKKAKGKGRRGRKSAGKGDLAPLLGITECAPVLAYLEEHGQLQRLRVAEGYLALEFDPAMVGGFGRHADEDVADLVDALKSNQVDHFLTEEMAEAGKVLVFPDATSVAVLGEFGATRGLDYPLAVVDEEGRWRPLGASAGFEELDLWANQPNVAAPQWLAQRGVNPSPGADPLATPSAGEAVATAAPAAEPGPADDEMDEGWDEGPEAGATTVMEPAPADGGEAEDDPEEEEAWDEDAPEEDAGYDDDPYGGEAEGDDYDVEAEYAVMESYIAPGDEPDGPSGGVYEEPAGAEIVVAAEDMEAALSELVNPELGIEIDSRRFDEQYARAVAPYEIRRVAEGEEQISEWLRAQVNQLVDQANNALANQHRMNVEMARREYMQVYRYLADGVSQELSIEDPTTHFGGIAADYAAQRKASMERRGEAVRERCDELQRAYDEGLQQAVDQAAALARASWDEQHAAELAEDKRRVGAAYDFEVDQDYTNVMEDLLSMRKEAARRKMANAEGVAVERVESYFMERLEEESIAFDDYRREIYSVLETERAADRERVRVQRDSLERDNELVRTRDELKSRFGAEIEQRDAQIGRLRTELEEARASRERQLGEAESDRKRDVKQKDKEIKRLKRRADELSQQLVAVEGATEARYQKQLSTQEDIIKSQQMQLSEADDKRRSQAVVFAVLLVVCMVCAAAVAFLVAAMVL